MSRPLKQIHWKDAVAWLESGVNVSIKCWKLSTGDIVEYKNVRCISTHWRGGTHLIEIESSGLPRKVRDITIFEINGYEIYR